MGKYIQQKKHQDLDTIIKHKKSRQNHTADILDLHLIAQREAARS